MSQVPTLLVMKTRGVAGNPQVFRLHGGTTLIPVGPPLPTVVETPSTFQSSSTNRVIQFGRYIYATVRTGIYRLDEGNPTEGDEVWNLVHTINVNSGTGYSQQSGIHIVNVGKTPTLVVAYQSTTDDKVHMSTSADGLAWTNSGPMNTGGITNTTGWYKTIVFRNKLYITTNNSNVVYDVIEIDVINKIATYHNATWMAAASTAGDFCAFDNRLWFINWTTSSANSSVAIGEFTDGTIVNRGTVVGGGGLPDNSGQHQNAGSMLLFTDGTDMFAIIPGDNGSDIGGSYAFRFTLSAGPGSTLSINEITSTTIPVSLRAIPFPSSFSDYEVHWFSFLDNSNPSNPYIHLWHMTTQNLSYGKTTHYLWNGPSTLIGNPPGTGRIAFSAGIALVHTKNGGGERIWSPGQVNAEILSRAAADNGQAFNFKVNSGAGSLDKKIRFWFDTDEEAATTPASIRPGSISGGNATFGTDSIGDYINVEADDTTVYCFIWDTELDNVAAADSTLLMPTLEE